MKRVLITAGLLVAIAGISATALNAQTQAAPIQTGYWEYKTKMLGITVDTEKKCITPAEVDKFLDGPCNRHHTCVYPVREVASGRANFDGYWQNKEGRRAKVKASGTYDAKRFSLAAKGTSTQGLPISATIEAKWLAADCPLARK